MERGGLSGEWSGWELRHGRLSREGSGRALWEAAERQLVWKRRTGQDGVRSIWHGPPARRRLESELAVAYLSLSSEPSTK